MTSNNGGFWLTRAKHKRAYTLWEDEDLNLRTHFKVVEERVLRGPFDSIKAARGWVHPARVELGVPDLLDQPQDDEESAG